MVVRETIQRNNYKGLVVILEGFRLYGTRLLFLVLRINTSYLCQVTVLLAKGFEKMHFI